MARSILGLSCNPPVNSRFIETFDIHNSLSDLYDDL